MSNDNNQEENEVFEKHVADPALLEAFRYINSVPGKDIRGKLIDCFQHYWLPTSSPDTLNQIKDIVGDLHNASLLVDDIEDNSKLRRGNPVAHSIFGIPTVINTANYVYFLALEKCLLLNNPKAMHVFTLELLNLHRGQGHDIMWRDNHYGRKHQHAAAATSTNDDEGLWPTEDEYCQMVIDKTGGLFRLAVGLLQACSIDGGEHVDKDFCPLVNNLGLYFQIRDDFINLADEDEYMKSKSFCEDLTEGKFSFPILHCIRTSPDRRQRLLHIIQQRTEDVNVKRYAQQLLRDAGSLEYTRERCASLKTEIEAQIEAFGGNPPLMQILQQLDQSLDGMVEAAAARPKSDSS